MTKRPRIRCIFCRGYGLSREHIIPDWVREIIPKKSSLGSRFILNVSDRSKEPPGNRPRRSSIDVNQGHPISRKIRVVCKRCNTGWLSALEDELKPKIKALVLGETLVLTPWDQRRLAVWAVKTAMTAEFIHPKSVAITFDEREHLRLHRDPPKEFNVWAAYYDGSQYSTDLHHHSGHMSVGTPVSPERLTTPNTQATTIGLGHMFFQVASSSFAGIKFNLKDESVSNLRRIWPPTNSDLPWPPGTSITDHDIAIIRMGLDAAFQDTI